MRMVFYHLHSTVVMTTTSIISFTITITATIVTVIPTVTVTVVVSVTIATIITAIIFLCTTVTPSPLSKPVLTPH